MKLHFWRAGLCGLAGLAAAAAWADEAKAGAQQTPLLPVKDFARIPDVISAKLSPDGTTVGFKAYAENKIILSLFDVATGKISAMKLGNVQGNQANYQYFKQVADFEWVGSDRVLIFSDIPANATSGGLSSVNREAMKWIGLTGDSRRRDRNSSKDASLLFDVVLYAPQTESNSVLMMEAASVKDLEHPNVVEMNVQTGNFTTVLQNPGDVNDWISNQNGLICGALVIKDGETRLRYRSEANSPWKDCLSLKLDWSKVIKIGIYGDRFYFLQPGPSGRMAIYSCDLKMESGKEDLVFEDTEYDILSAEGYLAFGIGRLPPVIFEPGTGRLLGVRYMAEGPKHLWFDPGFAQLQKQLQEMAPDLSHMVVNMDRTRKKLLIQSWSAREPGFYSIVDLGTGEVRPVAKTRPWINPKNMAEMYPIQFKARDGYDLHGYITMSSTGPQQGRPAVVLVHAGPWMRDIWGYDPLGQFLANRGYAVLQVNYRGSVGYGEKSIETGMAALGTSMIDDINDATRWAIAQHLIDPHRIAIMGSGFGGFNGLSAMAREPELYRCGIGVAALTDWEDLIRHKDSPDYALTFRIWSKALNSIGGDATSQRLIDSSPTKLAKQFRGPLLLVHSNSDNTVPIQQMETLRRALVANNKQVETLRLYDSGHGYPGGENGEIFLERLEKFLGKNISQK